MKLYSTNLHLTYDQITAKINCPVQISDGYQTAICKRQEKEIKNVIRSILTEKDSIKIEEPSVESFKN